MMDAELEERARRSVGTVLRGKYRLDGVIGVGGMASVFAATHRNLKRFAVKMLHPELSFRSEIRTRFLREGYLANKVNHPAAVAVLDDDTAEDGSAFLVMELLDGHTVQELWELHGGRFSSDAVLELADQLLDLLAAAHAQDIVHRDIKPANLFVLRDGTLKVLDFGIARVRDAASGSHAATGAGVLLGTPAFMPPEQALAKLDGMDGRTDVWAVGASMFTLLSGQFVHDGATSSLLIANAATQPARSLSAVRPDIDPRVAQIVDKALAFDPSARWQSAGAMRDAVRAARVAMGAGRGRDPLASLFAVAPPPPGPAATSGAVLDAAISATELDPAGASSVSGRLTPAPAPSLAEKTAQPVSSDRRALPMSRATSPGLWAAIGALVLAGGVAAVVTSGQRGSAGTAASTPPVVPTRPAPSVVEPALASASASASPAATAPPPPAAAAAADRPDSAAPSLAARPAARRPTTTTTPPSPAAASAPSPPKPSCDPAFTFDAAGKKHWKPGCED
jgi:serine/threonine-protein kinase